MSEVMIQNKPLCVISKAVFGEYEVHDIQTNSGWLKNPYGEDYAIVPEEMVESIQETRGFCDIVLDEGGVAVVSFTAREIPVIPESEEPASVWDELDAAYQEGVNTAYEQ